MNFPLQLYSLKEVLHKITAKVISNSALKFRKNAHFSPLKIA